MGDVETDTLVKTVQYSLAEVGAQTPVVTLRDVDAKSSANTLADRVAEGRQSCQKTVGFDGRITSLNAGRFADIGGDQDGWQNTGRRGGPGTGQNVS